MGALWAAFLGSRLGRILAGAGAVVLAIGAAMFLAFRKGKTQQANKDEAAAAREQIDAARTAQQTYTEATAAEAQVEQAAKQEPPPDTVKRDDLNNTF